MGCIGLSINLPHVWENAWHASARNFRIRHLQRESVYSSYHALKATLPMHYYDMPGDSFPTKHTGVYLAPSSGFSSFCTRTSGSRRVSHFQTFHQLMFESVNIHNIWKRKKMNRHLILNFLGKKWTELNKIIHIPHFFFILSYETSRKNPTGS